LENLIRRFHFPFTIVWYLLVWEKEVGPIERTDRVLIVVEC